MTLLESLNGVEYMRCTTYCSNCIEMNISVEVTIYTLLFFHFRIFYIIGNYGHTNKKML